MCLQVHYHRECVQASPARLGLQLKGQGLVVRSTAKEVARKEPQGLGPETQHTQSQTQGPGHLQGARAYERGWTGHVDTLACKGTEA